MKRGSLTKVIQLALNSPRVVLRRRHVFDGTHFVGYCVEVL